MDTITFGTYLDMLLRSRGYTFDGIAVQAASDPKTPGLFYIDHPSGMVVRVDGLGVADQASVTALVQAVPYAPYYERKLLHEVLTQIGALAVSQQTAIWNDLMSGTPPKVALDAGPMASDIMTMQFVATSIGSLTAPEKNQARQRVMSYYTWDNPMYLVQPPFDTTINVPAYEPAS